MSYEYSDINSTHQKHPKVPFQDYLYNSGEPNDDISRDSPAELEAELMGNSHSMRQGFRHIARRIRKY